MGEFFTLIFIEENSVLVSDKIKSFFERQAVFDMDTFEEKFFFSAWHGG